MDNTISKSTFHLEVNNFGVRRRINTVNSRRLSVCRSEFDSACPCSSCSIVVDNLVIGIYAPGSSTNRLVKDKSVSEYVSDVLPVDITSDICCDHRIVSNCHRCRRGATDMKLVWSEVTVGASVGGGGLDIKVTVNLVQSIVSRLHDFAT